MRIMYGSLQGEFGLVRGGIVSVPNRGVVISDFGDDDGTHDGGDVESGPLEHELVQHHLLSQSLVATFLQSVLNGDATGVVEGLGLISVVVGLNQEPVGVSEGVNGMGLIGVPLEDGPLIAGQSSNNEVNRSSDDLRLQSRNGISKSTLVLQNSPDQPDSGVGLLGKDTDEILTEILSLPGINIDRKSSVTDSGEGEDATSNGIHAEDLLISGVELDVNDQLREDLPHLEVQIPAVEDLPLIVAHQQTSAGLEGGELVHEVEEEEAVEGQATQISNCSHLGHEVLVLELVLGVPLDALEEALGDGEEVEEFDEAGKGFLVVSDDCCPADLRGVSEIDLVGQGRVALDGSHSRDDGGEGDCEEQRSNNQLCHDRLMINTQLQPWVNLAPPSDHKSSY